jgi:hypothetical protein
MNDRDALAALIADHVIHGRGNENRWSADLVDAILAAGWRAPISGAVVRVDHCLYCNADVTHSQQHDRGCPEGP